MGRTLRGVRGVEYAGRRSSRAEGWNIERLEGPRNGRHPRPTFQPSNRPPRALAHWHDRVRLRARRGHRPRIGRSEEHTSELQSRSDLVCRLLLEKKKNKKNRTTSGWNTWFYPSSRQRSM